VLPATFIGDSNTESSPTTPAQDSSCARFESKGVTRGGSNRRVTGPEAAVQLSACWRNLGSIVTVITLLGLAPPFAQTARAQSQPLSASVAAEDEIRSATMRFYVALNSALRGDLDPLSALWSHRPDVSNLSAVGGRAAGWNEVYADFQNIARFYPGGRIAPRDIIVVAGKDMGYSVCIETGQLRSPAGPMVSFNQRATNIFRLEDGKWKMIHHHADAGFIGSQAATR